MTGRNDEAPARRTIRSFVRRAGRITPSQERALDELWHFNPLTFDLALKRSLRLVEGGRTHRFPDAVFMPPEVLFPGPR